MWKIINSFLSNPRLAGLGALASIVAAIVTIVLFGERILNTLLRVADFIGKKADTPLHIFSAIIVVFAIVGFLGLLYRLPDVQNAVKRLNRIRIMIGVLFLIGVGGLVTADVVEQNGRKLKNTQETIASLEKDKKTLQKDKEKLEKDKERLEREAKNLKDTLQQKEKDISLLNQEKQGLKKERDTKIKEIKSQQHNIRQKDDEIKRLKNEVSKLKTEHANSLSRVEELEREKQELQVKISKLTKPEKETVSFALKGGKLFLRDGSKEEELFAGYNISCFSMSKTKKKISVIYRGLQSSHVSYVYRIAVFNADRARSDLSIWEITDHERKPPRNLKWVSDTVLRVNLFEHSKLKLDHKTLNGTGLYEITIDEHNSLVSVKKSTGLFLGGSG